MNSRQRLLAATLLATLAAAPAFAAGSGEADYVEQNRTPFVGTLSRADVQAQLAQAQRRGEMLAAGEALGRDQGVQTIASARSRADVRNEAVAEAHSTTQNLFREAFVNSAIPGSYTRGSLANTRQAAGNAAAAAL